MNVQEEVFRQDLVRFSHLLSRLGFTPGTSGNLSIRLDSATLLITPTGVSKGMLAAADMVIVNLQGRQIAGTRRVTSEFGMHLAVYEKRADINAVIHSHPPICTAFACSARGLEEVHGQEPARAVGKVPLACYATTGTEEVAASLQPHLKDHDAILLATMA